ncbi:phenol hydroxylase [Apiospora phragmitis]|uniref:Phenol hydroxylase n=1 Tax=Apiospora phragmitis TaxID=2905665 RepID=A0ABR1TWN2_9PEZI
MASRSTSEVDVLIVGAGPAGLMMALWMSRLGIKTRIVDKRTDKVFSGQADGGFFLEPRLQWGHQAQRARPGQHQRLVALHRVGAPPGAHGGLLPGRHRGVVPHPADPSGSPLKVERMVLPTSLEVDEAAAEDDDAHPVTVTLRHLTEAEATPTQKLSNLSDGLFRSNLAGDDVGAMLAQSKGRADVREEVVKAKYVVGCDGAHSWTRKALGPKYEMKGEMTDFVWGVMDIVPITDFRKCSPALVIKSPDSTDETHLLLFQERMANLKTADVRTRCMIHSASNGSLMIIPRENRLVRLYIQLTEVSTGGRVDRSTISHEMIFKAAQKIISPYKLEYHYCDWWTAYQIGQRVGSHFSKCDRVFLAGDAVHTHSPKAGQGMNVSMSDAYNLGWKIGLVAKKIMPRKILSTYELERKQIANELIEFDHKFSRLFSGRPQKDILDETGVSMEEFSKAFNMSHMFTSGLGVNYSPSALVCKPPEEALLLESDKEVQNEGSPVAKSKLSAATHCKPGMRFPSYQVVEQCDARQWTLHHKMPSDGRFRLWVFGGDISQAAARDRVNALGARLEQGVLARAPRLELGPAANPFAGTARFRLDRAPSVVDVLLVHRAPRAAVELLRDLHDVYHPFDAKLGWDYDKVFADGESYHEGHGRAYEGYGVDPERGAVVVVRPDGYVGLVTELGEESWGEIEKYFEEVLRMA